MMRSLNGFTLVELSVVLVIIALVAGGVLVGQDMIRQAGIRAVISEYDHYAKAIQEFQDKYGALPGDMNNATSFWGTLATCPPNAVTVLPLPVTTNTCNGDANGQIARDAFSVTTPCKDGLGSCWGYEIWYAWKHLSNAGMIDGKYTGAGTNTSTVRAAVPGLNVPASKQKPGGWSVLYYTNTTGTGLPADIYGHILMFGGANGSPIAFTSEPIIHPEDAAQIDRKLDDGKPLTGKTRAWNNMFGAWDTPTPSCIESSTSRYYTRKACTTWTCYCALVFTLGI